MCESRTNCFFLTCRVEALGDHELQLILQNSSNCTFPAVVKNSGILIVI